jgi:hypothetical protein
VISNLILLIKARLKKRQRLVLFNYRCINGARRRLYRSSSFFLLVIVSERLFFCGTLCYIYSYSLGEFFLGEERKKVGKFSASHHKKNIAEKRQKQQNTMTTTTLLTASSSLVSTRVQQQQRKQKNSSGNKNVTIIKALGGFGPEIKPEEIRRIQEERRKKIEQAKRDAEARKNNKNGISAKNNKNAKAKDEKPKKFFGLF